MQLLPLAADSRRRKLDDGLVFMTEAFGLLKVIQKQKGSLLGYGVGGGCILYLK